MNVLRKTKKSKTFFCSNKKRITKIDEDGNESFVNISYKIKVIDSARFSASSLSNLVDNLTEGIHKIICKDCDCFLDYETDNLIKYSCLSCNKDYSNKLDEKFFKKFRNTFKFSNNDINKFILLLRKGVYPCEYMDDWERFNETTLPEKEFYSNLKMEEITDANCMHGKRVCKDFEIKNLGEHHALCLKIDTLPLVVFENFRKMFKKFIN